MFKDNVDKTDAELIEEMAKSLGHTGYRLELCLDELKKIQQLLKLSISIKEYNQLVDTFNSTRQEALNRKQALMIHREAIGFRKHMYLDKFYPIPEKKKTL
ncbi:MAG: hypothetical protein JW920_03340 [Deltaproteobacteria bacterium]|nr:hypothetical protein [Deltaproteobacteria bacterium]